MGVRTDNGLEGWGEPVYALLGHEKTYPKIPYCSVLFGDSPAETFKIAREIHGRGYTAAKFGWGPMGRDEETAYKRACRR